jgi:hypothetical protein
MRSWDGHLKENGMCMMCLMKSVKMRSQAFAKVGEMYKTLCEAVKQIDKKVGRDDDDSEIFEMDTNVFYEKV